MYNTYTWYTILYYTIDGIRYAPFTIRDYIYTYVVNMIICIHYIIYSEVP